MRELDNTAFLATDASQQPICVSRHSAPTRHGQTLPPGHIHLGIAKEIAPTLRAFGPNPDPVIWEAGLDPCLFDDAANVIPHAALGRLLPLCVARIHCSHFGLLVGQRATILSFGLVGRLMQHSGTVGDALRVFVSNLGIKDRISVPALAISGDVALFSYAVYQPEAQSADQISEGAIAAAVNALRALCGSGLNPTEVLLTRGSRGVRAVPASFPLPGEVQSGNGRSRLARPGVAGAGLRCRSLVARHALRTDPADIGCRDRVIRRHPAAAAHAAAEIAGLLTMHRRTLSRKLKSRGSGDRAIANQTRFEIARQLLEDTEVPLSEIAAALGYLEASAFTRAFRRWSGQTPTAWRTESHHG